ncbi:MAG: uroporphyrinogen-III C-methyltransferase [Burkholderiaceae bacterium]|nr:uroporphyrinogen-III C-methyltransferase [Burkholderiaceae bacterium]
MTQAPAPEPSSPADPVLPAASTTGTAAPQAAARAAMSPGAVRIVIWGVAAVAAAALIASLMLWQKLSTIQEQLARQSADAGASAVEARALARDAQDQARETAARVAVAETRLSEVALQRSQLEELMQSLSRSRDENLVVDIESALRLAQQQAQLTGSVEPLLAALRTADQRIARAAQPRLAPLQRAIARDVDRIRAATVTDLPGLLLRLDDLNRLADDLPLLNAPPPLGSTRHAPAEAVPADAPWWQRVLGATRDEARRLVRVSRIEQPEAALLSPDQAFFLRENFKLRLLNVRLGVLARQVDSSRNELTAATQLLHRYFDPASRRTQNAAGLLQQVQQQLRSGELPQLEETFGALATAAAGR